MYICKYVFPPDVSMQNILSIKHNFSLYLDTMLYIYIYILVLTRFGYNKKKTTQRPIHYNVQLKPGF